MTFSASAAYKWIYTVRCLGPWTHRHMCCDQAVKTAVKILQTFSSHAVLGPRWSVSVGLPACPDKRQYLSTTLNTSLKSNYCLTLKNSPSSLCV